MVDSLAGIGANIGNKAVATLAESQFLRQFIGDYKQQSQRGTVLQCQVRYGGDVSPGDEQDVMWGLRIDIFKRYDIFILVDNFTGYLTFCYFAEQAVLNSHGGMFPPRYPSHLG